MKLVIVIFARIVSWILCDASSVSSLNIYDGSIVDIVVFVVKVIFVVIKMNVEMIA